MEFLLSGFCFSGSCCHFDVEMSHWKSSYSAVCVLTNSRAEVLAVTGFIAHLMCMAVCFQLLCQCKHEYMQVSTWSFHLNLQERSHFVDVESPCTAYSVNDNSSFFNAWLLNIMGLSLLSCEL